MEEGRGRGGGGGGGGGESLVHNQTHKRTHTMWDSSQSQFGRAGMGKQRIRKDYLWGGGGRRQGGGWWVKPVSLYHITGRMWGPPAVSSPVCVSVTPSSV